MSSYAKEQNKEFWVVGAKHMDYIDTLRKEPHVRYFSPTINVAHYVKNCSETGGILLGRTTIEGWMCGKSGWIYNVDDRGNILDKKLHHPPENILDYSSTNVVKKIKEQYTEILYGNTNNNI